MTAPIDLHGQVRDAGQVVELSLVDVRRLGTVGHNGRDPGSVARPDAPQVKIGDRAAVDLKTFSNCARKGWIGNRVEQHRRGCLPADLALGANVPVPLNTL